MKGPGLPQLTSTSSALKTTDELASSVPEGDDQASSRSSECAAAPMLVPSGDRPYTE